MQRGDGGQDKHKFNLVLGPRLMAELQVQADFEETSIAELLRRGAKMVLDPDYAELMAKVARLTGKNRG